MKLTSFPQRDWKLETSTAVKAGMLAAKNVDTKSKKGIG